MKKEDLHVIQKIGYEILTDVDRICKKHNIQYYLIHGTLLGAVRHHGPIPWDDDVDIAMTRRNYQKFANVANRELQKNNKMFIMGSGSTKYVSEIKIGRINSTYCPVGTEDYNIINMVHLDIFLLDYLKKQSKLKNYLIKCLRIIKLNWDEKKLIIHNNKSRPKLIRLLYDADVYLSHIIRFLLREINIEHIIYSLAVDKTENSQLIGPVMDIDSFYWDEKDFLSTVDLEYNKRLFPAPIGYKHILTDNYGDYMKEPDEDKKYRIDFNKWIFSYVDNYGKESE